MSVRGWGAACKCGGGGGCVSAEGEEAAGDKREGLTLWETEKLPAGRRMRACLYWTRLMGHVCRGCVQACKDGGG